MTEGTAWLVLVAALIFGLVSLALLPWEWAILWALTGGGFGITAADSSFNGQRLAKVLQNQAAVFSKLVEIEEAQTRLESKIDSAAPSFHDQ